MARIDSVHIGDTVETLVDLRGEVQDYDPKYYHHGYKIVAGTRGTVSHVKLTPVCGNRRYLLSFMVDTVIGKVRVWSGYDEVKRIGGAK